MPSLPAAHCWRRWLLPSAASRLTGGRNRRRCRMSQPPCWRGAAYPREVSRARDFTRSHGLQTSILFLIPFIQFTCPPDCPLLTLGKDRNRRLLSQPRERLSSLKDSTNAVFSYHRNQQLTAGNDGLHPLAAPCLPGIRE